MKVLIIDDHRLYANGIRSLLDDHDTNIKTEYSNNVFSALDVINNKEQPNLILLSINDNATCNSYDLIKRLNQLNYEIPVMVISNADTTSDAGLAIENNALGFISKSCTPEVTLEAIWTVLRGSMYISKPATPKANELDSSDKVKITERQQQVLNLLSEGLLNKQIADQLNISTNTVKAHLHDLFRHLQVTNRTSAVRLGKENGLI